MPRIERTIQLGSVINIVSMLAVAGVAYGVLTTRVGNTEASLDKLSGAIASEAVTRADSAKSMDARVRALEMSAARSDERFNSVLQVLGRIEARLERMEGGSK